MACALAALTQAAWIGAARADEPPPSQPDLEEARRLFHDAVEKDRALDPAGALALYEKARDIAVSPQLLFNIGSCQERLHRLLDAARSYRGAAEGAKARSNDEVARAAEARLAILAKITPRVRVNIPPKIEGIQVLLDDKPLELGEGQLGPIMVDPGDHRIVAQSTNDGSFELAFHADENEERNVDVRFPTSGDAPIRERIVPIVTTRPSPPPSYVPAIIGGAATVVLGTVAGITFGAGRAKKDRYESLNAGPTPGTADERQQLKDDGQSLYVTSTVFAVGAALAGGATIYLFLRARLYRTPPPPAAMTVMPTARGLWLGGAF